MTSLIIYLCGLYNLNPTEKLNQFKNHRFYAGKQFKIEDFTSKYFPDDLISYKIIIDELLANFLQLLMSSTFIYIFVATLFYLYFFKIKKQKYLSKYKGETFIIYDIKWSIINIISESFLVAVLKMLTARFSLIYFYISDYGKLYFVFSIFLHLIFDETFTYWIHRIFHTNRTLYHYFHKYHHKSNNVTPFSGFSFHPIDAFAQALPCFISCFFFPLNYDLLNFFSIITSLWAFSIHDNVPALPIKLFLYSTHHTIHHEKGIGKLRNFGKFTTVWDRLMGTYDDPDRVDFGWKRNKKLMTFFSSINYYIDKFIPDRTAKRKNYEKKNKT